MISKGKQSLVKPTTFFKTFFFFLKYFIVPCGKFGSSYPGKALQPQEQRYPLLSVCAIFSHFQIMAWLPAFGIFKMDTDADACDCIVKESALEADSGT